MNYITKIFPTVIVLILSMQLIHSQWATDVVIVSDQGPPEPIPRIQFQNSSTGWLVHPNKKDTVFKTTDGGLNWSGYRTVDTNKLSGMFFLNNNTGWVAGYRGKIAKTTDGGVSWVLQSSGVQSWLNCIRFIDANTGVAVGSKDSNRVVLKTTNGGTNWQVLLRNNQARFYSVYMTSVNSIYSVGDSGVILYSSNGGNAWVTQQSGTNSTLREIIFKNWGPLSIGYIAGKGGVILQTTNGGSNWVSRSFNTVNFYGIDFATIDTGYISGTGKIYKTTDGGSNWYQQTVPVLDTISIKGVFCINSNTVWAIPWSGNLIYTTNGGGPIGIQPISNEIPTGYYLEQNYPNPFNPNTKIRISIPNSSFTKLTIYDVTGKVMAILVNEELKPGKYEVDWDASHRTSGIYYYKLEAENFTSTRKMVLLK